VRCILNRLAKLRQLIAGQVPLAHRLVAVAVSRLVDVQLDHHPRGRIRTQLANHRLGVDRQLLVVLRFDTDAHAILQVDDGNTVFPYL